jgi:hypothetical protein
MRNKQAEASSPSPLFQVNSTAKKVGFWRRRSGRVTIILIILVVLGAAAIAYFVFGIGRPAAPVEKVTDTGVAKITAVPDSVQVDVNNLVATGDPKSIQQANQIINAQTTAADKSGDDGYIVDAYLAKADLLFQTNQPQEALDSVLLPLDQKYGNNDTYKYRIDTYIGQAYVALGDTDKANQYYSKVPPVEGN